MFFQSFRNIWLPGFSLNITGLLLVCVLWSFQVVVSKFIFFRNCYLSALKNANITYQISLSRNRLSLPPIPSICSLPLLMIFIWIKLIWAISFMFVRLLFYLYTHAMNVTTTFEYQYSWLFSFRFWCVFPYY